MQNSLAISCRSCTSQLQEIRKTVRQACRKFGVDEDRTNAVVLAIDEACANVIRHSCQFSEQFKLDVEINKTDPYLVFLIVDDCPAISPELLQPKAEDLLRPGGLGLQLIHDVMDSVELLPCKEQGNRLQLKLKL